MTDTRCCPVCLDPLPPAAKTGRPRIYCSSLCTERARQRVKRAARLLERADATLLLYGRHVKVGRIRTQHLRDEAARLLEGLPT